MFIDYRRCLRCGCRQSCAGAIQLEMDGLVFRLHQHLSTSYNDVPYLLPAFDLFAVNNGPAVLAIDSATQTTVRPYGFQVWSRSAWLNSASDSLTIEVAKPANVAVRLYLMIK